MPVTAYLCGVLSFMRTKYVHGIHAVKQNVSGKTMMKWNLNIVEVERFKTSPYRCMYLPTETALLEYRIITDLTSQHYEELLRRGWRRFGCEFFRPACPSCAQCRSLRIKLAAFTPSRSQQRTMQK